MQPKWKEPPAIAIRSARKPVEGLPLSGIVLVVENGIGYAYVSFGMDVVERIGSKMPYGVGEAHPAYLRIVRKANGWDVFCEYLDKSKRVLLWRSEELPEWVKRVKYYEEKEKAS